MFRGWISLHSNRREKYGTWARVRRHSYHNKQVCLIQKANLICTIRSLSAMTRASASNAPPSNTGHRRILQCWHVSFRVKQLPHRSKGNWAISSFPYCLNKKLSFTASRLLLIMRRLAGFSTLQTIMEVSKLPEATSVESGLHATRLTLAVW